MSKSSIHIFIKIGFVFTYRIVSIIYFRPGHLTIQFQVFISASRIRSNQNITPQIFGQLVYFSCVKVHRICERSPISRCCHRDQWISIFLVALVHTFFIWHNVVFTVSRDLSLKLTCFSSCSYLCRQNPLSTYRQKSLS